ncbi:MAG: DNA translocase FtsK, partial [Phototrophicaceae bacterium]
MSYDDYDEYEYEDDEDYYDDDDEEYLDYSEDKDSASSKPSSGIRPFGGGSSSGLPGSSSSGSRFGGTTSSRFGGGSSSRFGASSTDDDSSKSSGSSTASRFGGSTSGSTSSRFGSSASKPDDDKKSTSSSSSSRFGGGSTSPTSGSTSSRFGGGSTSSSTSSRFSSGASKPDDDKKSTSSSSSSSSRFGGGSTSPTSSSTSSRFGGGSSSASKPSDDKKPASSSSSSTSRFGGVSSRFGGGSKTDDKKPSDKSSAPAKKDDDSSGGVFGGIRNRLGASSADSSSESSGVLGSVTGLFGGGKKDDKATAKKDDKASGGSRFGGIASRFGGGSKSDDKKDDKASASSSSSSSSSSSRFGGGRFGGGSKSDDKKDSKTSASSSSSSSSSRFGGGRFGGGSKSDDKASASSSSPKQSPFGAKKATSDDKSSKSSTTAKAGESSGVLGRITSAFSFGGSKDDQSSKAATTKKPATRKVPKAGTSDGLTLDNWLDIIGVGLVVMSLVIFFSGLSQEQAAIGAFHNFLGELFGWGAFAVPITMFIIGVWLIVRHFGEDAPTVDPIRVVGVVMVFISLLYFFQWYDSFTYNNIYVGDSAITRTLLRERLNYAWDDLQAGGGRIGAELYYLMFTTVTDAGGFLLMGLLALIGIMFITRMSAAEILRAVAGLSLSVRENMKQRAVQKRVELQLATQQAAAEQARLMASGITPVTQSASAAQTAPVTDASGREIRMTVGGYAETISMAGQQNGQAPAAYNPAMPSMPVQQQVPQSNNSGSGLFGRLRGGNNNSGGFSLFGGNNGNNQTSSPPPPTSMPINPLPMDDGYSHFDTGPIRTTQPAAEKPQSVGDMLRKDAPATPAAAIPPPQQQAAPQQPINREVAAEQETEEVNDFLKQRQDRLDKLRRGEIGPISQSAMARARQEDVSSVIVPSNEGKRDAEVSSQFTTGIGDAVRAESTQQAGDGSNSDFTPPSKLPSVQADGDNNPKQQMLSVPIEKPRSSAVQSNKAKIEWRLPDYRTLLSSGSEQEFDREYLLKQAHTIEETLEAFGAPGRVVEVNTGPVITQFGVEPDYVSGRNNRKQRVKVSAIAGLDKDLQLALGARSIRVEAPVPGKGYVGIEVPNAESSLVSLRDVMDSPSFTKHKTPLAIALGQSVSGAPISADLSTMPHLLVAGTTGSGKSVCVNSIIASIISRHTPDEVKFIMVDPKRVELTGYNGIPHLVAPVVVELERIVGVLKWVTREMDARYKQFSEAGSRNIEDFNKHRDPNSTEQMPYMVVIIDELADLMMLAPDETERTITRIAALARATGIHLVIATQRPSVDVVTGLIKANFPARIAFAVAGSVDSRVILDQPGAERLLGKGDMLYLSGDSPAPLRLQGVYVSDMEINNIVRYWKMQGLKQPELASTSALSSEFVVEKARPVQSSSSSSSGGG